jgi:hypothetical protein
VFCAIRFEELGNIRDQWIIWVWVGEEGADAQQDLANGQCGTPLVLENIETDSSVRVNVAVVNAGGKVYFGRLMG